MRRLLAILNSTSNRVRESGSAWWHRARVVHIGAFVPTGFRETDSDAALRAPTGV